MGEITVATHAADFLRAEHRVIDEGFALYFMEPSEARWASMLKKTLTELKIHMELEEELFYPEYFSGRWVPNAHHESLVVHEVFKKLIEDIEHSDPADLQYESMVRVLWKLVARHFVEEEAEGGMLSTNGSLRPDLGVRLAQRREELCEAMSNFSTTKRILI